MMRVGWAIPGYSPSHVLGTDNYSYAIDGYQVTKISCVLDIYPEKYISISRIFMCNVYYMCICIYQYLSSAIPQIFI